MKFITYAILTQGARAENLKVDLSLFIYKAFVFSISQ